MLCSLSDGTTDEASKKVVADVLGGACCWIETTTTSPTNKAEFRMGQWCLGLVNPLLLLFEFYEFLLCLVVCLFVFVLLYFVL
jgi:hypothetical protein